MKNSIVYLAFGLAIPLAAQTAGSICGTVLDENGLPAKNVLITAVYMGAHSGMYPATRSDDSGHYCLVNVPYGDNAPAADDPKRGYPNPESTFHAGDSSPNGVAHLTAEHPRAIIDIRIPYKAAFLTLHLNDAITGKPQTNLFYKLSVQADPQREYIRGSRDAADPLLLPPNKNILLHASAPGYREWPYDGSPGYVLNLLPGEHKTIEVLLQPK